MCCMCVACVLHVVVSVVSVVSVFILLALHCAVHWCIGALAVVGFHCDDNDLQEVPYLHV